MIDLDLRKVCITSTDVGPIFGVDQYRDAFDVWAEKHGQGGDWAPTPRMLLGKDLEQGIVKAYERITDRKVEWADYTVQHRQRPWMAASPDALVVGTPLERGVDAKLVFWDQRRKWGEDANHVPEGIQLQMWWMMAVLECDAWDIAAWVGEDEPRIYQFERNREAERVVIAKCEEWHRRYVVGNEVPAISGSDRAAAWLQQAFPTNKRPDMREATEAEAALLEEYGRVRMVNVTSKARRAALENQIKLAIADREGLTWPGGECTWRKTKDTEEVNWEAVARGLLHEYLKDAETRKTLLGIHTKVEEGYRRIRFVSAAHEVPDAA